MKDIVILGGPNGAGKTTAARILLPSKLRMAEFMNADEIARDVSPQNVEAGAMQAGRLMLARMREFVRLGRGFAFETTCSGRSYLKWLQECQADGWTTSLLYLWLPSAEHCITRVAERVRSGGHHIPEEVIRRRYLAGVANMRDLYLPLADTARIYDNTDQRRRLVAEKDESGDLFISDKDVWSKIQEAQA